MRPRFGQKKNQNNYQRNRFQKPKLKEEFNIENLNFPDLNTEQREIKNIQNSLIDYKKLDFKEEEVKIEENKIKKGYLILNKENILKYGEELKRQKNMKEEKINMNIYYKMIANWESYRNSDIELYGDRSRFIENDREIERIISEELKIQKEIDTYNEDKKKGRLISEEEKIELEEYY